MSSQRLCQPFTVQFNCSAMGEEGTNLAFPFWAIHVDEDEHYSGWVYSHDGRNNAGLSDGANWRAMIGKGGPGLDASWSEIEQEEE